MLETVSETPRSPRGNGDSMAARLARQRQQRSMQRTLSVTQKPQDLHILQAEVLQSGQTIDRLQDQLRESEAEMEEMGARTARMQAQLVQLRSQLSDGKEDGGSGGGGGGGGGSAAAGSSSASDARPAVPPAPAASPRSPASPRLRLQIDLLDGPKDSSSPSSRLANLGFAFDAEDEGG